MSRYLFIQSQDPFTEVRTQAQFDLARRLVEAGHQVRMVLVQNAVIAARQGARCDAYEVLGQHGVTLLADQLALEQREIAPDQLKDKIEPTGIDVVIDALLAGDKVIWN